MFFRNIYAYLTDYTASPIKLTSAFLICIREIHSSNLDWDTDCSDCCFPNIAQFLHVNIGIIT
jgi:hypothetical protein